MKKESKTKIIKTIISITVLLLIILAIFLPLKLTGTLDKIDSAAEIKEFILSGGAYSYIIFFALQFLQVTFIPLPALITTVAGTMVFGPWVTFLISTVAIFLGSLFAFFLGKKIGRKFIVWIVGESDTIKWEQKLQRGKYVFFLMMLFPFFPDDILCLIAGTTNFSYKFFISTLLITRPLSIFCLCFFSSGLVIPYTGWGIPVWIIIAIIVGVTFYLSIKYQPEIEDFILGKYKAYELNKQVKIYNKNKKKHSMQTQNTHVLDKKCIENKQKLGENLNTMQKNKK